MRTAFVLVDVVPGMTEAVFTSLGKLQGKGLLAKEKVKSGSYDLLVKVQGQDDDAIDKFLEGQLKFISGVKAVRRVRDGEAEDAVVQQAMQKLR
jgi:DNA-binding Lrp family transcriptional regulator